MKSLCTALTMIALTLTTTVDTNAQGVRRNHIYQSGNGAYNRVLAVNRGLPNFLGHPGFGHQRNVIAHSGNGVGNTIVAQNRGRVGIPGYGYPLARFPARPGFCGSPGVTPYPGVGGLQGLVPNVNVNVIANSGNGIGNTVITGNGGRGGPGLNFNLITNSGNGVNNLIRAFNRRR